MNCCPNCFSDDWLIEFIRKNSTSTGECDYCGAADAPLVEVGQLTECFHNLLSMYKEADSFENGETLVWLIQWRWSVFNEDSLSEESMGTLLEDIANDDWDDDDGESQIDASALYMSVFRNPLHQTHRDAWEQFCFDVRRNPDTEIPFSEYMGEEFALSEMRLPVGSPVYRARVGFTESEAGDRLPWQGEYLRPPGRLVQWLDTNAQCRDREASESESFREVLPG